MEFITFGTSYHYVKVNKEAITFNRKTRRGILARRICFTNTIKKVYAAFEINRIINEHDEEVKIYDYQIWIEQKEGKKIKLFGEGTFYQLSKLSKAQKITDEINSFLEDKTYPKSNIIRKQVEVKPKIIKPKSVQKPQVSRRKITKEQNPSKLKIQDIRKGALVNYKLQTWEVAEQIQYDWGQGNTHILYRLNNVANKGILLLVAQNLGVYQLWIEKRLTYQELIDYKLDKIRYEPPLHLVCNGEEFIKEHIEIGYEFVADAENGVKIKQYDYLSENGKKSLRILHHEDEDIFVFSGKKVENFEFSKILIHK
jgi:hypothetical protein